MKTQSAKAKGRNLQKVVVAEILKAFPQLTDKDVRSTSMGNQGVDVQLSQHALQLFPYFVECKSRKSFALYRDFQQAMGNTENGMPLLVIKQNRSPPLAIVTLDHFMELASGRKTTN